MIDGKMSQESQINEIPITLKLNNEQLQRFEQLRIIRRMDKDQFSTKAVIDYIKTLINNPELLEYDILAMKLTA